MSRTTRFCSVCLVLATVALAASAAPPEQEAPKTPIEAMKRDLYGMQGHLHSMAFRIKRPAMGGMGADQAGAKATPTPGEVCCSGNLEHVNRHVQSLNQSIEALYVQYAERKDGEGRAALDDVRNELNIVARGVAIFKMAGTAQEAEQAIAGVTWPFNRLREAIDRLGTTDGEAPSGSQPPAAP